MSLDVKKFALSTHLHRSLGIFSDAAYELDGSRHEGEHVKDWRILEIYSSISVLVDDGDGNVSEKDVERLGKLSFPCGEYPAIVWPLVK